VAATCGGRWYGGGWGGPVAAGDLGGLALGALAGSAYAFTVPSITAAAIGRTSQPTTAGAILPATSPSKSAIDFGPVALKSR
jgi:hypothetical protein